MKKIFRLFIYLLFTALPFVGVGTGLLCSCSETDGEEEEFPDWKNTNEARFNSLYAEAEKQIAAGNKSWKIIKNWSLPEESEYYSSNNYDHIVVNVLEEGKGSGCPMYTDYARCHYKVWLLPSTTYPTGFVLDQSYYGTFDESTALPMSLQLSGSYIDGFVTAVLNMHIGDYWRVYIPYQLGYGEDNYTSGSNVVPGYSMLTYDIRLVSYYHPDADVPENN